MKIRERRCDICGQRMNHYGDLIIRRRFRPECDMLTSIWKRLDVCWDCADAIKRFILEERKQAEEE